MEITSSLKMVKDQGWRMGFPNLFKAANGSFWRTKKWLIQAGLWFFILNAIIAQIWKIDRESLPEVIASLPQITTMGVWQTIHLETSS